MKRNRVPRTVAATFAVAAVLTSSTGQAWAALSQPGTVKPSKKPAQQPGTEKDDKKPTQAPKLVPEEVKPTPDVQPAQQEAKPVPVVQPVSQEAAAPAPKAVHQEVSTPVVQQESAEDSESKKMVTPVRKRGNEPEVESVREANATLTTGEFRTAVHNTEHEHRDTEITSPDVKVARTEEEESAEIFPELDEDDKDDNPDVPAPAPTAGAPPAEVTAPSNSAAPALEASNFSGGANVTGVNAGAEIIADTTATTGLVHSEINVGASDGAGLTVDTNPTTSLVQGDLSVLGQQLAGEVQVTAVESQLYEITANGGTPLAVEIPTEVTTAVEQVAEQAEQIEVPVEVATAVEQATTALNDFSQQVSDAIPPANAVEAALPAGAVAAAWYEITK